MKCKNCSVEWTIPSTYASKIDVCPFCGESMQPEKPQLSSLDDVLLHILKNFGDEIMRDGTKLQSLFADLAPQLKREKVMLRYFVECNGNEVFLCAIHEEQSEANVKIKMIMDQMENELLVSHDAVQQVCRVFWHVIGGETYDCFLSEKFHPVPTATDQLCTQSVTQGSPIPTQDDRLLQLIDKKNEPTEEECRQLTTRGKELLQVPDSVDAAIEMIRYSAQYGSQEASILLGECYEKGVGVPKNDDVAEGYYRRAAVSGNCEAQYKLGVLFHKRRQYIQAKEWIQKAADVGYRPAIDCQRLYII